MEPVTSWSPDRVHQWLRGLDAVLQQYPFEEWQVSGSDLLQLSYRELEKLGVQKIGHQELLLEAVEKLCSLTYSMSGETLRSLTEKLRNLARSLQMGIQSGWKVNTYNGQSTTKLPTNLLQNVLELITAAKALFSLLNRFHFAELSSYTASRDILSHCQKLGVVVQKEVTVFEKEKDIISICRQLLTVCDDILNNSPEALLNHSTQLESVHLVPLSPGDHLGIEITTKESNGHYITGTTTESAAEFSESILVGDEVIQVNDQIVVGWSRLRLVEKLQENPSGVTLVLKKVPVPLKREEKLSIPKLPESEQEEKDRHSLLQQVSASVRSLSFRTAVQGAVAKPHMGQEESEPALLSVQPESPSISYQSHGGTAVGENDFASLRTSPALGRKGSAASGRESVSSCPDLTGPVDDLDTKRSSTKGTRTAMSRRRVSCRELGRPDCDGWLWKKKKESGVFVTQKWQRFWFVLKGPTLYWYASQQEEKAEGLLKIASYSIEGAGEHKRKNVFQMCHPRFQKFFFAAENASDMSKWINCLFSSIQKYKKLNKNPPDSEEECYSETEPEDEGSHSPRSSRTKNYSKTIQSNTLPLPKTKKKRDPRKAGSSPITGGGKIPEDEMGVLFHQLKEGGVSLIGHDQPLTHDHFRRSFIRRNKNPVINEKAHTLRALQSTLKAKEAELQLINRILEDSELTADKFHHWKEKNEDLFQEIQRQAIERAKQQPQGQEEGAPDETPAASGSVFGLSLSDGEQLVDAEDSSPAALQPVPSVSAARSNAESFFI